MWQTTYSWVISIGTIAFAPPLPSPQPQRALASAVRSSSSKLRKPKPPSVISVPPATGPPVTGWISTKSDGWS